MKTLKQVLGGKQLKESVTINETLETCSSVEYSDVWDAIKTIKETCNHYGLEMPVMNTLENTNFGEEVFEIDEDCYLYFAYSLNEQDKYDIVSCVVNEEELNEIMVDDDGDDDDDDNIDHFKVTPSLLIRLMEYAREDIKDDITIHKIVDKMNEEDPDGETVFCADHFESITSDI